MILKGCVFKKGKWIWVVNYGCEQSDAKYYNRFSGSRGRFRA